MMAHDILGTKRRAGISIDILTSSKLETEGYSFWPAPWKTGSTSLIETAIGPLDFVGLVFGGFCFTREENVCWNRGGKRWIFKASLYKSILKQEHKYISFKNIWTWIVKIQNEMNHMRIFGQHCMQKFPIQNAHG